MIVKFRLIIYYLFNYWCGCTKCLLSLSEPSHTSMSLLISWCQEEFSMSCFNMVKIDLQLTYKKICSPYLTKEVDSGDFFGRLLWPFPPLRASTSNFLTQEIDVGTFAVLRWMNQRVCCYFTCFLWHFAYKRLCSTCYMASGNLLIVAYFRIPL